MTEKPKFIIVDLFCGAGGTTRGFTEAIIDGKKLAKIIACVNHDPNAILSHWANHPEVKHFEEDIRTLDLTELIQVVAHYRALYPDAKLILWASLECTNFSRAKGGQPRDGDSRTLAEHLFRYVDAINPDYVQIENVVEFKEWGPMNEECKPIKELKGIDFDRWRAHMCEHGYYDEWKELNSADFGAYTSRNRLFGCFARPGVPIIWPTPTHAKKPTGNQLKHLAVKTKLKLERASRSVFNRKKPLSDNTINRVYLGLVKFPPKEHDAFISSQFTSGANASSVDNPAPTITTVNKQALVQTSFLSGYYGNGANATSTDSPAPTITTKDRLALVQTAFIFNPSHGGHCTSIDAPCVVIVARQDKAPLYLIQATEGVSVPVYDTDSPAMVKLKELMAEYQLADVFLRMLDIDELLPIQGFPDNYILKGTQADQKKFIGNSVVPQVVKSWCEAMAAPLFIDELQKAA